MQLVPRALQAWPIPAQGLLRAPRRGGSGGGGGGDRAARGAARAARRGVRPGGHRGERVHRRSLLPALAAHADGARRCGPGETCSRACWGRWPVSCEAVFPGGCNASKAGLEFWDALNRTRKLPPEPVCFMACIILGNIGGEAWQRPHLAAVLASVWGSAPGEAAAWGSRRASAAARALLPVARGPAAGRRPVWPPAGARALPPDPSLTLSPSPHTSCFLARSPPCLPVRLTMLLPHACRQVRGRVQAPRARCDAPSW